MDQPLVPAALASACAARIGGAGVGEPQIVLEHRQQLRGEEAALGQQMPGPLAQARHRLGQRRVEEDQRLGVHPAILDEAERQHVDAGAPGQVGRARRR